MAVEFTDNYKYSFYKANVVIVFGKYIMIFLCY